MKILPNHETQGFSTRESDESEHPPVPTLTFAGELVRLAEVVKHNLESGIAPVQTLSQLNAMEPIIGILRVTGLKSMKEIKSTPKQPEHAGYL